MCQGSRGAAGAAKLGEGKQGSSHGVCCAGSPSLALLIGIRVSRHQHSVTRGFLPLRPSSHHDAAVFPQLSREVFTFYLLVLHSRAHLGEFWRLLVSCTGRKSTHETPVALENWD